MKVLYRDCALAQPEIGRLVEEGIDYSAVSQARKRKNDHKQMRVVKTRDRGTITKRF